MEARIWQAALLAALLASLGASSRTTNFIVHASSPRVAEQVAREAERFRQELAVEWLGREIPRWESPCPITVTVGPQLGAGGATTFMFDQGRVFGWQMSIQGSLERVLDSVLPHEVTHTVFASHFRRPLPRWADEGACTTVEHSSERAKHQKMLVHFLRTGRGISFSRLFAMREYPRDIMPLYAQGYSIARFLIEQEGRRTFINFVADGLRDENWHRATKKFYGYDDLDALQQTWLGWVKQGSPLRSPAGPNSPDGPLLASTRGTGGGRLASASAAASPRPRPEPNLILHTSASQDPPAADDRLVPVTRTRGEQSARGQPAAALASRDGEGGGESTSGGWHAPGSREPPLQLNASPAGSETTVAATEADDAASRRDVTRPQPPQPSRQIILQWSRETDRSPEGSTPRPPASPRRSIYDVSTRDGTLRR